MSTSSQPVELVTAESGSVTVQVSVTSEVYQPCDPSVPTMFGVMTGGVASVMDTVLLSWVAARKNPLPASSASTVQDPPTVAAKVTSPVPESRLQSSSTEVTGVNPDVDSAAGVNVVPGPCESGGSVVQLKVWVPRWMSDSPALPPSPAAPGPQPNEPPAPPAAPAPPLLPDTIAGSPETAVPSPTNRPPGPPFPPRPPLPAPAQSVEPPAVAESPPPPSPP